MFPLAHLGRDWLATIASLTSPDVPASTVALEPGWQSYMDIPDAHLRDAAQDGLVSLDYLGQ